MKHFVLRNHTQLKEGMEYVNAYGDVGRITRKEVIKFKRGTTVRIWIAYKWASKPIRMSIPIGCNVTVKA